MEYSEIIEKRLTTLKYTNEKVEDKKIQQIIDSAIIAPSAKNRQPWRFYVLNNKQKEVIAKMMEDWKNNTGLVTTVKRTANIIKTASTCILVYIDTWDKNQFQRIGNETYLNGKDIEDMIVFHDYYFDRIKVDILSIGAAVENMILKATELGIGSTWIGDILFIDKKVNKYLEIHNKELICAISLGYKDKEPIRKGRFKKDYLIIGEKDERRKLI